MEAHKSNEIVTDEQPVQLTYMRDIEVLPEDFPILPALLVKKQKKNKKLQDNILRDDDQKKVENVKLINYN